MSGDEEFRDAFAGQRRFFSEGFGFRQTLRISARSYPEVKGEGSGLLHKGGKCRVEVDHWGSVTNRFATFFGNFLQFFAIK